MLALAGAFREDPYLDEIVRQAYRYMPSFEGNAVIILDTDSMSLLMHGHDGMRRRVEESGDDVATTIITRIEILQGRFAAILKAADGKQLHRAAEWLDRSEELLLGLTIIGVNQPVEAEFDRLLSVAVRNECQLAEPEGHGGGWRWRSWLGSRSFRAGGAAV